MDGCVSGVGDILIMFDKYFYIIVLGFILLSVFPSLNRYDLHNKGEKLYLLDKWTGKTWLQMDSTPGEWWKIVEHI